MICCLICRSVSGNSITDHLVYYGIDMGSDEPESCRIVMDTHVLNTNSNNSTRDSRGNLILSRDPATPLLKLKREIDNQEKPINVYWIGMRYLLLQDNWGGVILLISSFFTGPSSIEQKNFIGISYGWKEFVYSLLVYAHPCIYDQSIILGTVDKCTTSLSNTTEFHPWFGSHHKSIEKFRDY